MKNVLRWEFLLLSLCFLSCKPKSDAQENSLTGTHKRTPWFFDLPWVRDREWAQNVGKGRAYVWAETRVRLDADKFAKETLQCWFYASVGVNEKLDDGQIATLYDKAQPISAHEISYGGLQRSLASKPSIAALVHGTASAAVNAKGVLSPSAYAALETWDAPSPQHKPRQVPDGTIDEIFAAVRETYKAEAQKLAGKPLNFETFGSGLKAKDFTHPDRQICSGSKGSSAEQIQKRLPITDLRFHDSSGRFRVTVTDEKGVGWIYFPDRLRLATYPSSVATSGRKPEFSIYSLDYVAHVPENFKIKIVHSQVDESALKPGYPIDEKKKENRLEPFPYSQSSVRDWFPFKGAEEEFKAWSFFNPLYIIPPKWGNDGIILGIGGMSRFSLEQAAQEYESKYGVTMRFTYFAKLIRKPEPKAIATPSNVGSQNSRGVSYDDDDHQDDRSYRTGYVIDSRTGRMYSHTNLGGSFGTTYDLSSGRMRTTQQIGNMTFVH